MSDQNHNSDQNHSGELLTDSFHLEFSHELQRRLVTGEIDLTAQQRAMLWRSQMGIWLSCVGQVPPDAQDLVYQAVNLIGRAAFLVEHGLETRGLFEEITEQLSRISDQIAALV